MPLTKKGRTDTPDDVLELEPDAAERELMGDFNSSDYGSSPLQVTCEEKPKEKTSTVQENASIELVRFMDLTGIDLTKTLPEITLGRARLDWIEEKYKPGFEVIEALAAEESPSLWQVKQIAKGDLMPAVQERL